MIQRFKMQSDCEILKDCIDKQAWELETLQLELMQQKTDFEQSRIVDCSYHHNKIEQMRNEYVNLERTSTTLLASLSTDLEESMKSEAELE